MAANDSARGRRESVGVRVGAIRIGGGAPVVVQSMTNTDTADARATAEQVKALADAGSEIVHITVDTPKAAAAVPTIRERLEAAGCHVPLGGDFQYNGHWLLTEYPACAEALDKYRINPGNVGFREKRDTQFQTMIEVALTHDRPVRIGVNWGSLDQDLLAALMDENTARSEPKDAQGVMREALVESGLRSAALTEQIGLARDKIVISAKVSQVQDLIAVYGELGARGPRRPRHAGRRSAAGGGETRSETTHRRARRRDLLPALRLAGLGHRVGGTRAHGGWRRRRFGRRREPMAPGGEANEPEGDWSHRRPGLTPGGWAFQYRNDFYPDVDDTAVVAMALHRADGDRYREPVQRAVPCSYRCQDTIMPQTKRFDRNGSVGPVGDRQDRRRFPVPAHRGGLRAVLSSAPYRLGRTFAFDQTPSQSPEGFLSGEPRSSMALSSPGAGRTPSTACLRSSTPHGETTDSRPANPMRFRLSYCQKLVTQISGGAFG